MVSIVLNLIVNRTMEFINVSIPGGKEVIKFDIDVGVLHGKVGKTLR